MAIKTIFISSVQKELEEERQALKAFIQGDPMLRRYFDVFLFEDLPAADRSAETAYLEEVDQCSVYLGLFGKEYGFENEAGVSPTELEFDRATKKAKTRLIYVKGKDDKDKHPKMRTLIRKAGSQLIRRRFSGISDLTSSVYSSLVEYLVRTGMLHTRPFDAAICHNATLKDISAEKIQWFLERAQLERQYPLKIKTPPKDVLTHLNLLEKGRPSHAAILLFGKEPQKFLTTSEIKCMHFHGTKVSKPIPSYQIYKGTIFELVDNAIDFVMSKLNRSVGTREHGPQAPVTYELPREVVAEFIVNAVAHRDYASNASVQVMLFADRLEIWNPGELPTGLTPELLLLPHASIPRNPLISDPLFLTHYIEKAGTGIIDAVELCRVNGIPEPSFKQNGSQFVTTLRRDWLTDSIIDMLDLNERQKKAISFTKGTGRIGNSEYQKVTETTKKTATRDLENLVEKGVMIKKGQTGRGTYYVLAEKGDIKGT